MATFNGDFIFGVSTEIQAAVINPRAQQKNGYPGQSGVESLDQGQRGAFTLVSGRLYGVDASTLSQLIQNFRAYHNGRAYTLVDQFGNSWPWVKLESFQPEGRILRYPDGACSQKYSARFEHLLIPSLG
jgi:hypothetical protein